MSSLFLWNFFVFVSITLVPILVFLHILFPKWVVLSFNFASLYLGNLILMINIIICQLRQEKAKPIWDFFWSSSKTHMGLSITYSDLSYTLCLFANLGIFFSLFKSKEHWCRNEVVYLFFLGSDLVMVE